MDINLSFAHVTWERTVHKPFSWNQIYVCNSLIYGGLMYARGRGFSGLFFGTLFFAQSWKTCKNIIDGIYGTHSCCIKIECIYSKERTKIGLWEIRSISKQLLLCNYKVVEFLNIMQNSISIKKLNFSLMWKRLWSLETALNYTCILWITLEPFLRHDGVLEESTKVL